MTERGGGGRIVWGLVWLIGGAAATFGTHDAASALGGGTYWVFWGAIVYGAWQVLLGLFEARNELGIPIGKTAR